MKVLVLLMIAGEPDLKKIQSLESLEADRVWSLYEENTLKEIYLLDDKSGAVIVLDTTGLNDAKTAVESLPMVKEGVLKPNYMPLAIWPEMQRLLVENNRQTPSWWPN